MIWTNIFSEKFISIGVQIISKRKNEEQEEKNFSLSIGWSFMDKYKLPKLHPMLNEKVKSVFAYIITSFKSEECSSLCV